MRILWVSNAPHAPTGYGNQTALFPSRLKAAGHDLMISAFYGLDGSPIRTADGILVMPSGFDTYGNDIIVGDATLFNADIVITLYDSWVIEPTQTMQVRWCPWFPVDHDPIPPEVLRRISKAFTPIVYSRFAQGQMEAAGVMNYEFVPHGVDTGKKGFWPENRKNAREGLGAPNDIFLIGMVAANKGLPSRKAFEPQLRAFKEFHKRHPDSMFYIHTDFAHPAGLDIDELIEVLDLPPGTIAGPPQYRYRRGLINTEHLRSLYSALDVLTNVSLGEGFGIPIVEAQACGTPVIVGDWTSMPELVGAGWKVEECEPFYSQETYQFIPRVGAIVDAYEEAYKNKDNQVLRKAARKFVRDTFDADFVTSEYWVPALERIAVRVDEQRNRRDLHTVERRARE